MPGHGQTERAILSVLSDGKPRSRRELVQETGLSTKSVEGALYRLWRRGVILRTERPIYEVERVFRGRAGVRKNTRGYHLYLYMPGRRAVRIRKLRFVTYDKKLRSERGLHVSKAELIREFLRKNHDRAFFSTEIAEALKEHGVKPCDVMNTVRRAEKKGLVYVRGYRSHDRETPFKEGYLITWIDQDKPREQALEEAVRRTEEALAERASANPIIQRVHRIRDMIIEAAKLRDIVSFDYIHGKLGCTGYEAERTVARALQLYPDLKEVKLFNAYRYYYHASMPEEDLRAAIKLKEEYIRKTKGRANRIGHNWEACVEWFIDKFTTGASFWTQSHRGNRMDPRRITLHLVRSVGGRRQSAEVDRVWEVTPGVFAKPVIYVLECKWGLVRKRDIDGFFEVLRWSKEFGVDTPEGRRIKQGVIGVFAGSTFNPREKVRLKDETEISLPAYAARMNIQLLKRLLEGGVRVEVREKSLKRKCLFFPRPINEIHSKNREDLGKLVGYMRESGKLNLVRCSSILGIKPFEIFVLLIALISTGRVKIVPYAKILSNDETS